MKYYRRLAAVKDNRNASFSGMYAQFVLLRTQKRWLEADAVLQTIRGTFPRLQENYQRNIDWWRNYIREQLAKTAAKPQSTAKPASPKVEKSSRNNEKSSPVAASNKKDP